MKHYIFKHEIIKRIAELRLDYEELAMRVEALEKAQKPAKKTTKKATK